MVQVKIIYSAVFAFLTSSYASAEEGDPCKIIRTGQDGICTPIDGCSYAKDLLRTNIYPQTCGFIGKKPLVCCIFPSKTEAMIFNLSLPNRTSATSPSLKPITSSTLNAKIIEVKPSPVLQNIETLVDDSYGEFSRNKCLFYYPSPSYPIFVTGGTRSLAREFPHMAIIGYGEQDNIEWLCGGSLISKKFLVTAAHCLTSKIGEAKYARLGDLDLSTDKDDASPEDFKIVRTIPHPLYKPPERYHDIALLQLDREVALSAYVSPACLHTEKEPKPRMTATGWGRTKFGGNSSTIMMKVELDHIPNKKCIEDFGQTSPVSLPAGIVEDSQICAGGSIGQDTCQGDSGGPLQTPNKERRFTVKVQNIIGITSFGRACGLSKAPGIYTRVYKYIPWIESIAFENETHVRKWTKLN